jgi:hypothetical protein
MLIESIPNQEINKLYVSIYGNMSSFRKRSISFIISPHSNSVASVILYVTGKRGTVTKDFIIIYNEPTIAWNIYCEGKKYTINSLNELPSIVSNMVQKMSTVVTKI